MADQRDQQRLERNLVGRLGSLGRLDHRDELVQEGFALVHGDPDDDLVGYDLSPGHHAAAIAAGLPDHRGRFAGDGGLVDHGRAVHDLAVRRDGISRLDEHEITLVQVRCRDHLVGRSEAFLLQLLGHQVRAGPAQLVRLGLALDLGDRLGEVREQHGQPEPHGHQAEEQRLPVRDERVQEADGGDEAADLHRQHHRVPPQVPRVELDKRADERLVGDLRREKACLPLASERPSLRHDQMLDERADGQHGEE